ncbi:DUF6197 family protein [Kitasatospora cineracea]|uniref:Uncharacterized protein n=1 Tax=Kitasatospora cineracea TaxID=88074 RepID=A0A3N4SET3_9ACTN|nr:hypothetical protein [Kitasatospora cineracea]RPE34974.1 hypothetical protein EDD38_3318 [Kitasatospora cineracea]
MTIRVGSSLFAGVSPSVIPAAYAPLAVQQVLQLAAEYVEVHGHHKGDFAAEEGRAACAVGAIRAIVTGHRAVQHPLAAAAVEVLSRQLPDVNDDPVENVASWNDEPTTTALEVTRVLRAAALAVAA